MRNVTAVVGYSSFSGLLQQFGEVCTAPSAVWPRKGSQRQQARPPMLPYHVYWTDGPCSNAALYTSNANLTRPTPEHRCLAAVIPGVRFVMLAGRGGLRPRKKLRAKLNLSVHLKPNEDVPRSPLGSGDSQCCTLRSHGIGSCGTPDDTRCSSK